jgi:hypothetical protein
MLNVKDPGQDTRSVQPCMPRSPEEHLALYAWGPDDLQATLAGLSREDLDQARAGQWAIICLTPGLATCGSHVPQSRERRRWPWAKWSGSRRRTL